MVALGEGAVDEDQPLAPADEADGDLFGGAARDAPEVELAAGELQGEFGNGRVGLAG